MFLKISASPCLSGGKIAIFVKKNAFFGQNMTFFKKLIDSKMIFLLFQNKFIFFNILNLWTCLTIEMVSHLKMNNRKGLICFQKLINIICI